MKQDTRLLLLQTGRRLFARHGFDATSVRAITTAAHTNLGAITYHFGSKRSFYEAVLESCAQPLADAAIAAATGEGTASERVAAVIRAYFGYLGADANIARLLMQELVLGRTPPESTILPIRRIHQTLTELVLDGQQRGEFRAGDAPLLAISIISQPVHLNLVRRVIKALANIDLEDAATRTHVVEHAIAFACAGLAHESGSHESK